jgi:hypothetical protein
MMAKTAVAYVPTEVAPPALSTKLTRQIDAIRGPFASFTRDFSALVERREELAPKFMKAFGAFQAETTLTFVSFVRHLDPSVPEGRNDYRNHRAYQAADYLRRLVARRTQKANAEGGEQAQASRPTPPMDVLARFMAALIPAVADASKIWQALETELNWTDRQVSRLKSLTEMAHPLLHLQGVKNARVRIEHTPEPSTVQQSAA